MIDPAVAYAAILHNLKRFAKLETHLSVEIADQQRGSAHRRELIKILHNVIYEQKLLRGRMKECLRDLKEEAYSSSLISSAKIVDHSESDEEMADLSPSMKDDLYKMAGVVRIPSWS